LCFVPSRYSLLFGMWLIDLFLHAGVGIVCAVLGQFLTGKAHGGCLISVLAGLAGSYAGPWAAEQMARPEPYLLPVGDVRFPVATAALGAFVFVVVASLLTRKRNL